MSFPLASRTYPLNYAVSLTSAHLKQLAKADVSTHISKHAERLHQASEAIMLPARWNVQLLGRMIQPLAGANKDYPLRGAAIRIASLVLWILSIPFAILSALLAYPLRLIDHGSRPAIGYIDASNEKGAKPKKLSEITLTKQNPLHIRTHNIGFVTSSMSHIGDLRPPVERAHEIVDSILNDPAKPSVICFQESSFNEDACSVLCKGIMLEYPYIIHHVAPQISGFSSGAMIASKYPIEHVEFHRFTDAIFPETMAPKGVIKARFQTTKGPLILYSAHTQPLIGEERAQFRCHNLNQIKKLMDADKAANKDVMQVLSGDFNTSRITAWGEDNMNPSNQAEAEVLKLFNQHFDDMFLRDHDAVTGARTKGSIPMYLPLDNKRMGVNLLEPKATWYDGPLYEPGYILSSAMKNNRLKHKRAMPHQINPRVQNNPWGKKAWRKLQPAENARFDFMVFPKDQTKLDGRAEIRRVAVPEGAQSSPTDHLPVDAVIWMKYLKPNLLPKSRMNKVELGKWKNLAL